MKRTISLPKSLYAKHGSRAVILLHAYTGSPNDVRMLCRFLEQANYTVFAPMFTGHGTLEPREILQKEPTEWQKDTCNAVQFLKNEGYKEIAVLGLSMGGLMAVDYLTKNEPEILGGGAFCSPIFREENQIHENFIVYAKALLTHEGYPEEQQAKMLEEIIQLSIIQLKKIEDISNSVQKKLAAIQVPVFLAQAGKDQMIRPQSVYQTAQALSQTKVTLQWYPESGHVITVGKDRKEFEQDVLKFLQGLSWSEE